MRLVKTITSADNATYKRWLRVLQSTRAMRDAGCTIAEGLHLAESALKAAVTIEALVVRQGAFSTLPPVLLDALEQRAVQTYELSAALYDRLSPVQHGVGLLLVIELPAQLIARSASAADLMVPPQQTIATDVIYLDGIQDPGNVGTLIRVAAAAGVSHVLASPGCAALWSARALRAGQGAHFALQLHEDIAPASLPKIFTGTWIAAVAHQAPPLWQVPLPRSAVGWMLGSEGAGLSPAALALNPLQITIPLHPAAESLNVAAAAAVCLFERQRRLFQADSL